MLYPPPPDLPPQAAVVALVNCDKGSRDCFPRDRVGGFREEQGELDTRILDTRILVLGALKQKLV